MIWSIFPIVSWSIQNDIGESSLFIEFRGNESIFGVVSSAAAEVLPNLTGIVDMDRIGIDFSG